jgi:hypothetical protein
MPEQPLSRAAASRQPDSERSARELVASELRYHVPMSQVWEGSRGRQKGHYHIHVTERLFSPPLVRERGQSLCGKSGWYEHTEPRDAEICPSCLDRAGRYGVQVPPVPTTETGA